MLIKSFLYFAWRVKLDNQKSFSFIFISFYKTNKYKAKGLLADSIQNYLTALPNLAGNQHLYFFAPNIYFEF